MGIILRRKSFSHVLEIDLFRNTSQNVLGVLKGDFWEFGCQNDKNEGKWMSLIKRCRLFFFTTMVAVSRGDLILSITLTQIESAQVLPPSQD